jgi:lipopolysaccharide export system protein LptA
MLCCLCLLLTSKTVFSLPDDGQQPINFESDSASQSVLDNGNNKIELIGNVIITQGSLQINGEHITIEKAGDKVNIITAKGQPAHFQQQSAPTESPIKAQAKQIQYLLSDETLTLTEDASIAQDGSVFTGDRIIYNVATENVSASGTPDKSTRVTMVLEPSNKTPKQDTQTDSSNNNQVNNDDTAGE